MRKRRDRREPGYGFSRNGQRTLSRIGLARQPLVPQEGALIPFFCSGNIIRSPMCEALMKRVLTASPECSVTSAGLNANPGRQAHPWAITAAQEFGISLREHRARRLTLEMVEQADVILAMDYQNQVQVLSRFPSAKRKLGLLGAYLTGDNRLSEIRDPYNDGEAETRNCYHILNTSVQNLASRIQRDPQAGQVARVGERR